MNQRLRLILCTALSLPSATSNQEKSDALERALKPLVRALFDFKQIKTALAVSGHVLDWCEKRRREYVQAIKDLIGEKRVELLSSGYYDPIFPLIPRADCTDQIEHTSTRISKIYRRKPRGVWINQLLWESSLITSLTKCAMQYTFLQDVDCIDYNREQQHLTTPVITEHAGKSILVFPIATRLCHLWHEHKFRMLIRELRSIYESQTANEIKVVTLVDSSEEQRSANFIQRFFQILTNNNDWIQTVHPSNIPINNYAMRTSYFYSQRLQQLKRNVGKDSEVGRIYATMHYNHNLISQMRSDKQKKRLAKDLILQGQNYYSFLDQQECRYSTQAQRKYAYSSFIEMKQMFYKERQKRPTIVNIDYDFDGVTECLFSSDKVQSVIHRKGGALTELCMVMNKWNWLDMPSVEEAPQYQHSLNQHSSNQHSPTSIDQENRKLSVRNCAIDYIIPGKSSLHKFLTAKIQNYSLANQLFELSKIDHEQSAVHLQTTTEISAGSEVVSLDLKKQIRFRGNAVTVNYQLQNRLKNTCKAIFATQISISPSLDNFDQLALEYVDLAAKLHPITPAKVLSRLTEIETIHVHSEKQKHSFKCRCAGSDMVFLYRIREQKAIAIIPCWNLLLGPQDSRSLQLTIEINRFQNDELTARKRSEG